MRVKLLSILAVLLITLMACQGNDDAQRGTNNPNIDPTTNRNTGDGIFNNDQDYMIGRDGNDRGYGRDNHMNQNRNGDNVNSRYSIGEEAADRIEEEIDEIDNAYVVTTENNAYVAAELDDDTNRNEQGNQTNNRDTNNGNNHFGDDEISNELKERIAEVVRSVDKDIENVYVATNPDFVGLFDNYADEAEDGRPIAGFFDQFEIMIERIFPENAGR